MKKLSSVLLLMLTMLVASCGKKDVKIELKLTADKTTVAPDGEDVATFTVTDQVGQDYTSRVTFTVNGEAMTGNKFSSKKEGEYVVVAKYGEIVSNELKVRAGEQIKGLILKADKSVVFVDGVDRVTFRCYDADQPNIVPIKGGITYKVNGAAIEGNSYIPQAAGAIKVTAEFFGATSEEIEVKAETGNFTPTARVLLEDYTATWCPYCPYAHEAITTVVNKDPKYVPLFVHLQDKMEVPIGRRLAGAIFAGQDLGLPTIHGNRKDLLERSASDIENKYKEISAEVGIALSVKLDNGKVVADAVVRKTASFAENARIMVALYENGIVDK